MQSPESIGDASRIMIRAIAWYDTMHGVVCTMPPPRKVRTIVRCLSKRVYVTIVLTDVRRSHYCHARADKRGCS